MAQKTQVENIKFEDQKEDNTENLVKDFEEKKADKGANMPKGLLIFLTVLVLGFGVASGYFLSRNKNTLVAKKIQRSVTEEEVKAGVIVGVADESTFKDVAEGTLENGGINGEGSHHLVRPGGESQNVYLTSSIVNLDQFAEHKIRVWGETFAAQKAGWLMDVGRLEVLE